MNEQFAPTLLSQFIRLDGCQRFLYFRLHDEATQTLQRRYGVRPSPLSPLLERAGQRFEDEVVAELAARHHVVDLSGQAVTATVQALHEAGHAPTILVQAALEGRIGPWRSAGQADLIQMVRDRDGALRAIVADIKASREERLEHRVQIAIYALLLEDVCRRVDLPLAQVTGAVVHRTATGQVTDLHDQSLHFDITPYRALVLDLVVDDASPLNRAAHAPLQELPFAFNARCDGCPFDTICLPHAAEQADIALVPDISRAARSALAEHDIRDLRTLAALKRLDASGKQQVDPEHADRVGLLLRDPVVAPQLDRLIARAKALARKLDPSVRAPMYLPDYHTSPLPDRATHPHLLQLFLDFQADDVTGGVYLAAGLLRGADGERVVMRFSATPPTAAGEADLLAVWAAELEGALRDLATSDAPPLHVLVYDRRSQRIALEACARNAHVHPLLSALVAWLQEQPQVDRATCAQLRAVIRQQRNLQLICDSLYAVAQAVWGEGERFSWRTTAHDFTRLFRNGVFDNQRRFVRDAAELRAAKTGEEGTLMLEAASRFSSQIPSAYAYAIWEHNPGMPTADDLLAFAEHRLRAMEHVRAACRSSDKLDVPLLPLAQLPDVAALHTLRSALTTFLETEHAASLAELLAHVRQPIVRRVLTGRTALLEAIEVDGQRARFRYASLRGGGNVQPRFKTGDWAVLNEAVEGIGPWEVVQGRLAIISAMTAETIELELTSLSSPGKFKFKHNAKLQVQPRSRYTLDEMADDLVADRVYEALDYLGSNPLARWIEAPSQQLKPPPVAADTLQRVAEHLLAHATPTDVQRDVIASGVELPLRLVQGPPGTGKSRTLGLAVVARLLAAVQDGKPLRIAVAAKTHSAAQVALDSIARAWQEYLGHAAPPPMLADLPIVKLGGDSTAPRAHGVRWVDPRKRKGDLRALLDGAVVVGGTPSGLDMLLRTIDAGARWNGRFDLLLIDEASQMSLPEGLLAASVLHRHGQMIVVGDHRQMPPIIIHPWDNAVGALAQWAPERSLFRWLLDAGAPRVALDQSFRVHRDHAAFLQAAIYHADGILFHSRRTDLLPPQRFDDPFVAAALRHDVPLVVVEHNERASRQSNDLEAELVTELVRACSKLGLDGRDGIGVVVPHRAQKAVLRAQLPELAKYDGIDTVERFQGGERDVIIVACTASDPDYVSAEAEFLMDPQRLNVALSRARKKLIVVASVSVFSALPTDLPLFERAALWKRLRAYAASHLLWQGERHGYRVSVAGPRAE